jgi:hypothetical protein
MEPMSQANSTNITGAPGEEPAHRFDNLAMAVSPAWHQAILRLANASERVVAQLEWVCSHPQDGDPNGTYVAHCRELVADMLEFLDGLDADPDLESTMGYEFVPGSDECEIPEDAEPSLGSFDRMIDQEKSWRTVDRNPDIYGWASGSDNELDDCDYEDGDPAEESEASGIGDQDGLDEQVPFRDWQNVGMV